MLLWDKSLHLLIPDEFSKSLHLLTPDEFSKLPDGFELESILGSKVIKGKDEIDDDTRAGYLAYGIRDIYNHPARDDVLLFLLKV